MASATVRVEKATSDLLIGPDWSLNIDICDSANSDYAHAKEVIKAVKKRLHHKSPNVQFLTLTLLETLMKNCGDYVHQQVSEREILQDMVKIVKKKSDPQIRDKILSLLDSWQEAFGGPQGKFPQYFSAFAELKGAGVIFPERSSDDPPIITPPATHFSSSSASSSPSSYPIPSPPPHAMYTPQPGYGMQGNPGFGLRGNPGFGVRGNPGFGMLGNMGYGMQGSPGYGVRPQPGFGMPVNASVRLDEAMASDRVNLSFEELESMRSVMELLSDMLRAVNPNDPEAVKDEVISDLVEQCRLNEKKLTAFITSTQVEQLLEHSLELNDKLQSLLAKHDSILSGSAVRDQTPAGTGSDVVATPVASALNEVVTPVQSGVGEEEEEEDDDEFAQLARRNSRMTAISNNGSGSNNPLSLPNPPAPIKTSQNREDEMINLLNSSLTFSPPIPNPNQIQYHTASPVINSSPSYPTVQSQRNPSPITSPSFQAVNSPNYPIQNPNQIQNQNYPIQYRNLSPMTSPTFQATSPVINSPSYPNQIQNSSPTFQATSPIINSPNYPNQNSNSSPTFQATSPMMNSPNYPNQIQNPSPTFRATSPMINSPSYPTQNPNQLQNPNQIQYQNHIQNSNPSPTFQATSPTINSSNYPIQHPNPKSSQFQNPNQFQNQNQFQNPNQFQPPDTSSYPPPPWATESDPTPNYSTPNSNSNSSSNSNRLNGSGASPRPSYISSNTFFGDLVELRNPDGSLRPAPGPTGLSSSYNSYMNSGRK